MNAPRVTVREVRLYERDVTLRLPFKFGVVTLTEAPQAFVRLRIAHENGREEWGTAAELMVPKWFDKNPDLSNEDNFDQLRLSLSLARDRARLYKARSAPPQNSRPPSSRTQYIGTSLITVSMKSG